MSGRKGLKDDRKRIAKEKERNRDGKGRPRGELEIETRTKAVRRTTVEQECGGWG